MDVRGTRALTVMLAVAVALAIIAPVARADDLAPVGTCAGADLPTGSVADQQNGMLCLINYARGQHSLAALSTADLLMRSAGIKAGDEVSCNDFSHTPCGRPVTDPFQRAGYIDDTYEWQIGENLATATAPVGSPRTVMDAWLHSQEHRDNLLTPGWKEQGIALVLPSSFLGATGSSVWVSHFGERHQRPSPASGSSGSAPGTGAAAPSGTPSSSQAARKANKQAKRKAKKRAKRKAKRRAKRNRH
jgi:uncharacterized protein YkwD